jgi:predicted  nucleic acid-binding Zn-ribbon protein
VKHIDKIKMEIDLNRREVGRQRGIYLAEVEKEMQMLDKFERWIGNIENEIKAKEEEFGKLMNSHQYLGNEIDRLSEYILINFEGEPSKNEGAVDTAVRLLGAYLNITNQ